MATEQTYYIGLMSGTSLDGIDGVLATFDDPEPVVLRHGELLYPDTLKADLLALFTPGDDEIQRIEQARHLRNLLACELIEQLCAGLDRTSIAAIADHGQTIRHFPDAEPPYTLQLQHGAALAEHSGIDTVVDFRSQDIAAGGQGAPLVPAFHQAVFAHGQAHRAVVNIGGIANLSLLAPGNSLAESGFDTGPGNTLLDTWCQAHTGQAFDDQGQWAASGTLNAALLACLQADPYFRQTPPKSTGREYFNPAWLEHILSREEFASLPAADIQATLSALTAHSIILGIEQACDKAALNTLSDLEGIYLCGGGAYNRHLVDQIRHLSPAPVATTEQLGVPPKLVEATAFAWLGQQAIMQQPVALAQTTGARHNNILGAVYRASP